MDEKLRKLLEDAMPEEADEMLTENQQELREFMRDTAINVETGEKGMSDEQIDAVMESMGGPQGMETMMESVTMFARVTRLAEFGRDTAIAATALTKAIHDHFYHEDVTADGECEEHDISTMPFALREPYIRTQVHINELYDMWQQMDAHMKDAEGRANKALGEITELLKGKVRDALKNEEENSEDEEPKSKPES